MSESNASLALEMPSHLFSNSISQACPMVELQGTTHLRLGHLYYAVSWDERDAI